MFLRIENVFPHGLKIRGTHTKKSVAILPMKIGDAQRLDELGQILLENLNDLSRWKFFREIIQDVNVISDTANGDCITLEVLQNP